MSGKRKRGPKAKYNSEEILNICKKYVNEIFDDARKVVSKASAVWKVILREVNLSLEESKKTSAAAIHTHITCNRTLRVHQVTQVKFRKTRSVRTRRITIYPQSAVSATAAELKVKLRKTFLFV